MITTNLPGSAVVLALMGILLFWMNRAVRTQTLVKKTVGEVVYERPMVMRSLFGFLSLSLAMLTVVMIQREMQDAIFYQRSTGTENSTSDYILMLSLPVISAGLPCLLFLWMAGPYRILLDFNHCRYCFTQGLPLMTKTKNDATDGGTFYITKTRAARHQMRFRPRGHKWGYLLDSYGTDEQARTQAQELAENLGLSVERRDVK